MGTAGSVPLCLFSTSTYLGLLYLTSLGSHLFSITIEYQFNVGGDVIARRSESPATHFQLDSAGLEQVGTE